MRIVLLNFALMPKRRKAVGQLDMSLKIKKKEVSCPDICFQSDYEHKNIPSTKSLLTTYSPNGIQKAVTNKKTVVFNQNKFLEQTTITLKSSNRARNRHLNRTPTECV